MYWVEENDGKLRMYSLEEFLLIPNAHLFGNPRVQETVQNGVRVSTVFLHVAHGARGGKPLLYETMVFGVGDEMKERYTSREEAVEGHDSMCRKVFGSSFRPTTTRHTSRIQLLLGPE